VIALAASTAVLVVVLGGVGVYSFTSSSRKRTRSSTVGNRGDGSDSETRLRAVEAELERQHKEWLRLSRQLAKARYDDRQASETVPQNGQVPSEGLDKDPRFAQYFD
ncbi:MAG: hypothetical protein ACFFD1_16630, partial [Candidatus Thorarchaeota archaeon]